jgi:hypothetical protein
MGEFSGFTFISLFDIHRSAGTLLKSSSSWPFSSCNLQQRGGPATPPLLLLISGISKPEEQKRPRIAVLTIPGLVDLRLIRMHLDRYGRHHKGQLQI